MTKCNTVTQESKKDALEYLGLWGLFPEIEEDGGKLLALKMDKSVLSFGDTILALPITCKQSM